MARPSFLLCPFRYVQYSRELGSYFERRESTLPELIGYRVLHKEIQHLKNGSFSVLIGIVPNRNFTV